MKKAYYARPVTHYGQWWDDATLVKLMRAGFCVIDPNNAVTHSEYKERGMEVFTKLVAECDVLFWRPFADGTIGAGVQKEIAAAAERGIPTFRLNSVGDHCPTLTVEQTREKIRNGDV